MEMVMELLGNYAFPIVAFFGMAYVMYDMNKKHAAESAHFAEAIANNTKVMERVLDVLQDIESMLFAKNS